MKGFVLVITLLISANLYAQRVLDMQVAPRPLQFLDTVLYPAFQSPMKKLITIYVKDTLDIYHFDKKGNETIRYNYSSNKPVSTTITKYTNGLKSATVFTTKYDEVITHFKYDSKKRMTEWGKIRKFFDTKIIRSTEFDNFNWLFEYDRNGNLIKKYHENDKKQKILNVQYTYNNANQLTEALFEQHKVQFDYANGLLVKKSELFIPQKEVTSTIAYSYNDQRQLVKEVTPNYTLHYIYEAGLLKKCVYDYKLNNGHEEVEFYYENNTLSKVDIKRNDYFSLSPFYFSNDYLFGAKKNDIQLRVELIYDSHNNIKELKHFVGDVYKYSRTFVYEYY